MLVLGGVSPKLWFALAEISRGDGEGQRGRENEAEEGKRKRAGSSEKQA